MRRRYLSMFFALSFCAIGGCAVGQSLSVANRQMWQIFRPKTGDYEEMGSGGSEWDFVGIEGRGDRKMEKDPDPWFMQLQSERARAIERNCGVE